MDPRLKVLVGRELAEGLSKLGDKAHLDVSGSELGSHEVLLPLERAVEIAEMVGQLAVNSRPQRRASITQP